MDYTKATTPSTITLMNHMTTLDLTNQIYYYFNYGEHTARLNILDKSR